MAPDVALEELDARARARSMDAELEAVQRLDQLLILCQNGTALLDGERHDRRANFLIGLLGVRMFNSLWRAREDAVSGYYVQALMLARAALEDWITMEWVEAEPSRCAYFLHDVFDDVIQPVDRRGRPARVPFPDKMLADLPEQLRLDPKAAYKLLSRFAHPRATSLKWQFHLEENDLRIRAGGHFDNGDLRATLFFLTLVTCGVLPTLERLQGRWRGAADPRWVGRCTEAVAAARVWLDGVADELPAERG